MALSILDGTQTATTLSTILSSGQHIPAHTVVSLGTQAITDIVNATSAGLTNTQLRASAVTVGGTITIGNSLTIGGGTVTIGAGTAQIGSVTASISGTVPVSGTFYQTTQPVSLATLPALVAGTAQIGSVTASISGTVPVSISSVTIGNSLTIGSIVTHGVTIANTSVTVNGTFYQATQPISISSVTIGNFPATQPVSIASVTVGNSITIGQITSLQGQNLLGSSGVFSTLKIRDNAGTYGEPVGSGLNVFNLPVYGSVTASISGTVPISISSVTVGNSVTIGSLPAISGTVTANTFAVQGTSVTTSDFTSITPSTVLANFNATRKVLSIFNEGAGNLHICAGVTCTTIAYQVRLLAGDYYEVPNHQTTITHSAVFATAGTARVTQVS